MNTNRKTALKNGTAKAASFILGDAHLIFQSLADGCINLEGKIVNKLTGEPYDEVREKRFNKTRKTQEEVKNMFASFRTYVKNSEHADTMDAVTNLGEQ